MAVFYFLLVLSVLVLIHEAGHYFAARLFGVKADEFGYGFPPRLIGFVKEKGKWKRVGSKDDKTYPGTIWSLNWLPLGGFVRIKGEAGDVDGPDSFHSKPIWQRIIILSAGVFMNWVLATVLFATVFMVGTPTIIQDLPAGAVIHDRAVRITDIVSGSPADKAGLQPNDAILSVDGTSAQAVDQTRDLIAQEGTKTFPLVVQRGQEQKTLTVTPAFVQEANRVALGIGLADVGTVSFSPVTAIQAAVLTTYGYTKAIVLALAGLFVDLFRWHAPQDLAGPVGIAVMTGKVAQQGLMPLLQFAAILSINLAVVNFLPIPALDGGRVVFLLVEKLRRRPLNRNVEATIHNVAFVILILLVAVITVHDISRFGPLIVGGLKSLVGM